jgi:hydrogenase nickel incorporation protein HypB
MFRVADLVVLTKIDLLPHLPGVSLEGFLDHLHRVNPEPRVIALSALTGAGLAQWADWLERSVAAAARRGQAADRVAAPTS